MKRPHAILALYAAFALCFAIVLGTVTRAEPTPPPAAPCASAGPGLSITLNWSGLTVCSKP